MKLTGVKAALAVPLEESRKSGFLEAMPDLPDLGALGLSILRTIRDPVVILRPDLRVHMANEAYYKIFKTTPEQTLGQLIDELGSQEWKIQKLRTLLEEILPRHSFFNDFEVSHDFPQLGRRTMLLDARELDQQCGSPQMILLTITDITARQRLDERVRISEIRYRRLFEVSHHGILILDSVSRKITDANPAATELLGWCRAEILGRELWQIGLIKDERASHTVFRELQQRGSYLDGEVSLKTKSGKMRVVEITANCYEENGASVIQCNLRDITERKQAEEARRRSEERYRTLFELGPVAVYSCDASGVMQDFNRRAAELRGRSPALGETEERFCGSYKLFRPEGAFMPARECPMAEVLAGKIPEVHDAEVIIERPDGSRITVIVNIRPLRNENREIIGAINCFYDITGRKQAELATASLAAIVESSDDAIISKDLNSTITSWNKGAERLFGYTAQEVIGQSITILIPPDRRNEEPEILKRLKNGDRVDHFETVRLRKDGSPVEISLTISPIRDAGGRIVGASKIARDITERNQTKNALALARENILAASTTL